jgi:tetratricopeptide (TPR) repeat protein
MLDTITISCPKCQQTTKLAVASASGSELAGSASACRACRARLLTFTRPDGQILIVDGESKGDDGAPRVLAVISPVSRSGYRVVPPEHLGIFDRGVPRAPVERKPTGASDADLKNNVFSEEQVLYRPDGSRRPPKDAAKLVGWRAVWIAQLNEALRERLAGPPPLSFPPGIFISYRWGTQAENDWTAELARQLTARGYPVIFDREKPAELDVPEMVSQIADCRFFLAVLDPGYVERLGSGGANEATKDGWVFDEYNTAAFLSNQGQLRILGLLRNGSQLPRGFREPVPGRPGNAMDVRTPKQLALVLDEAFPPIQGGPDAAMAGKARGLLRESHEELCAGHYQEAFDKAQELAHLLPGVVDGPAQQVRVALRAGAVEVGWEAAEQALKLAPESRELLLAAGSFAGDIGRHREAITHLAALLQSPGDDPSLNLAGAHSALGNSLDEFDQVYPAIAHLELGRSLQPANPDLHGTLGYVYRRAGELERAIECLRAGLKLQPDHLKLLENLTAAAIEAGRFGEARTALGKLAALGYPDVAGLQKRLERAAAKPGEPTRLVKRYQVPAAAVWCKCTECAARIPLDAAGGTLCVGCGSSLPSEPGACPNCGASGRISPSVPGLAFECPYCRRGQLGLAGKQAAKAPRTRVKNPKGG